MKKVTILLFFILGYFLCKKSLFAQEICLQKKIDFLLNKMKISHLEFKLNFKEINLQKKMFIHNVSFLDAFKSAVISILNDFSDIESPLSIVKELSFEKKNSTENKSSFIEDSQKRLKYFLNHEESQLYLVPFSFN